MSGTTDLVPAQLEDRQLAERRPASLWRDTLRVVLRQRSAVVGLALLAILLFAAVFADVIAPYDPDEQLYSIPGATRLAGPCIHLLGCAETQPQFVMGLDSNARDEFSRVLHGSRISLQIGLITVGFAIVVGTLIGAISGYAGGWVDNVLMRIMDVVLAFPALILAIAITLAVTNADIPFLDDRLRAAMFAVGLVAIPVYARVMRASVLSIRERDFVTASRALGESGRGILFRRILPNALTPLIVQGTLGIAGAILEVAALSFVGLAAQPPAAEWGSMIGAERNALFSAPHLVLFPGIALSLSVLGFNLLGDGLRDALDPRLNR